MTTLQVAYGTVVGSARCAVILTRGQGSRATMTLCGRRTVRVEHDERGKRVGLCAQHAPECGAARRPEPQVGHGMTVRDNPHELIAQFDEDAAP